MWKKSEEESQDQPAFSPPAATTQPSAPRSEARRDSGASGAPALIGPSILVRGDVLGEEDLTIEGSVEGKIELVKNNVLVGKNGRVKADIFGKVICVEGEVNGNLHASEQLILRKSSNTRGNIIAARVSLEDGANFKGSIDMTDKKESVSGSVKTGAGSSSSSPSPQTKSDKNTVAAAVKTNDPYQSSR